MQYRVRVIAVSGPGKKIFKLNDVVKDTSFREGRAEELVKLGYLERLEDGAPAAEEQKDLNPPPPPAGPNADDDDEKKAELKEEEKAEYDNTTRNELMSQLTAAEVEFGKNLSKAELFKLYKETKANQDAEQKEDQNKGPDADQV